MKYLLMGLIALMGIVTSYPVTDGDLYWHVHTGQWIVEHRGLPTQDPFCYTTGVIDTATRQGKAALATLQGYWLGQVLLFFIWKLASDTGIVLLRALVYVGTLAFSARWLLKRAGPFPSLVLIALEAGVLCFYPNERPQLFAFFLFPVLLFLLERVREQTTLSCSVFFLPLVCLLWGNVHGSFLLAAGTVAVYGCGEIARGWRQGWNGGKLGLLGASFLAAFASPTSFSIIWLFQAQQASATKKILEYYSPLDIMRYQGNPLLPYWGFVLIAAVILTQAARRRKLVPEHLFVLAGLIVLSFTGARYMGFALLAAPLLGTYAPDNASNGLRWLIVSLAVASFVPGALKVAPLPGQVENAFPAGAVGFLNSWQPEKNLFNYYDWGGYLPLRAPGYQSFIDGRVLDPRFKVIYDRLVAGDGEVELLDRFHVNTVVVPVFDTLGNRLKLPYKLLETPQWFPVFSDDSAVIFARNTPRNRGIIERFALPKTVTVEDR